MAWFTVSVSDPAAPVAVDVADAGVPGGGVAIVSRVVSPAAPFTHVFCRMSVAEVRVLVIVHVTGTGVPGIW